MQEEVNLAIEELIASEIGKPVRLVNRSVTHGGCIHQTEIVETDNGMRFFVKTNDTAASDIFEREAEGLQAMEATQAIRIPKVIGYGSSGSVLFLVLEAIESIARRHDFFASMGQQLAQMHKMGRSEKFGFESDNYLGSAIQENEWSEDWVRFWQQRRLGFQFEWARKNGYSDSEFNHLSDRMIGRCSAWLKSDVEPSLLHGDLWSGNFMVGEAGEPVLIDPAVYYGHREAEFGMTTLFGGFDDSFYAAYQEVFPPTEGFEERVELYRLYHVLNHLNLFGASYRSDCLRIMKKFA